MIRAFCNKMGFLLPISLLLTGCGITVKGKVDTSGTNTIQLNAGQVLSFFTYSCSLNLGPSRTNAEVSDCVSKMTQDFSKFLETQK